MKRSDGIKEIANALSKAQAAFPPIPRSKEVLVQTQKGSYRFKYAPFEEILKHTRGPMEKNGLSFSQGVVDDNYIETLVMHSSGEWLSSRVPLIVQWVGPQALGSALSYSKRYGFCSALGIHADDDDDGNMSEGNKVNPPNTPTQAARECYDALPQDMKDYVDTLAHDLRSMLGKDDAEGAWRHLESQNLDAENKAALWSLLDSKARSAIKKQSQSRKEAA